MRPSLSCARIASRIVTTRQSVARFGSILAASVLRWAPVRGPLRDGRSRRRLRRVAAGCAPRDGAAASPGFGPAGGARARGRRRRSGRRRCRRRRRRHARSRAGCPRGRRARARGVGAPPRARDGEVRRRSRGGGRGAPSGCAIPRVSRWRAWNVSPRVATTSPRPSGRPPVRRPRPSSSSCSRASARLARSPRLDLRSPPSTSPRRASRTPSRAPPPRASSRASSATPSSISAATTSATTTPRAPALRLEPRAVARLAAVVGVDLDDLDAADRTHSAPSTTSSAPFPFSRYAHARTRARVSAPASRPRLRRRLTRATLFPRYLRHPHRPRYLRRRRPRRPRGRHRRVPLSRTTRRVPPSMFPPTRPFLEIGRRRRFGRAHSSRTRRARHASNGPRRGPPGGIEMEGGDQTETPVRGWAVGRRRETRGGGRVASRARAATARRRRRTVDA